MDSNAIPNDSLAMLNIKSKKELKKFYSKWSISASKAIQQYAKDHSLEWFNTKWKNKSKIIPFYIRTKAPKSFTGNIWFASRPTNYAMGKGVERLKATRKAIQKGTKVKPYKSNGKWYTPKKYKPDIKNLEYQLADIDNASSKRFFVSKTSHHGTHKYSKPMLWFQDRNTKKVGFVNLKEQLSDKLIKDDELYKIILNAFEETVEGVSK